MTLLCKYYVPGLAMEDHSIDVPLDWAGKTPGESFDGETIKLFYRVVTTPEHVHDDLPLLIFLQGGPGGAGPRLNSPASDGWIEEATKHFRVILPDQRGTGRSSRVDTHAMARIAAAYEGDAAGTARAQADFLKKFLADSIVRDFEHLRLTEFDGRKWVTMGQSYGGFLTLTYLSLFPAGVIASFTTGGIPHVPADATEVYEHTFPRMARKTAQFYERYPQDRERVETLADKLPTVADVTEFTNTLHDSVLGSMAETDIDHRLGLIAGMAAHGFPLLPNGDPLTVERLQCLGSDFGMKPSFERVHWILDDVFLTSDGSSCADADLSDEFLAKVMNATASRPLYWPLQEFIYANGEMDEPIRWAAQRVRDRHPEFGTETRPLNFTGEAMFPWMFEQESTLRPFKPAMDVLMEDTRFGVIYDEDQLARNEVPLQAAVYFDDMYVDSGMQLDTLSRVGNSHYWTTNEFEHDGLHGSVVFKHLWDEALNRGDLEELF
ncbi:MULTISPECIES: alpha/beta fold hydrolase [Bifidobacterium]|uniref:Putative prolyl aminopeptidase n=1 Tax=Bifidobacterium reuteri DSM 23975 TaxID=1437610 RepID=A0A087CV81_9BIFI|nr:MULTISPECIES: alpha/beta fold hydrolase [Bifidobacterium]KFI87181.1 putative prolyl aminopeptidase [Bifidobacterium reuteri DSM 23975]TPF78055.1 proline iminopeptidase [Bifidobacterium sp. UTCIF-1]TPF80320.1 proline iminopeptidase [Bifidobacterium sp. UTCIF-24]TPF81709.1 proline iminopeptidase [Bifidobacterium sp. UTCIF-3]TPF84292.1 proline iminopeptidase [Bifidobacterium sp. UTCIF-36]